MTKIKIEHTPPSQMQYDLGIKFRDDIEKTIGRNLAVMLMTLEPEDIANITLTIIASAGINLTKLFRITPETFIEFAKIVIKQHEDSDKSNAN